VDRLPFAATPLSAAYDGIRRLPVTVLLDNVRSMYNIGSFFRTADACAAEAILLAGIASTPDRNPKQIAKTALGAELTVPWRYAANPLDLLPLLPENTEIAAIETTPRAVDLFDWQPRFPVCILFGHEVDGLQPALSARAHVHVRLPMLGVKHSLNVATAGGIVLYELLRKYRNLQYAAR
jgi:23S rRNA (guanosine2251-2'-O)-methyltransferase